MPSSALSARKRYSAPRAPYRRILHARPDWSQRLGLDFATRRRSACRSPGLRSRHCCAIVRSAAQPPVTSWDRTWLTRRLDRLVGSISSRSATVTPSYPVLNFLLHQYVEGFPLHPVTTSVRRRGRCARPKVSAGLRKSGNRGTGVWMIQPDHCDSRSNTRVDSLPGAPPPSPGQRADARPSLALRPWRVTRRRRRRRGWPWPEARFRPLMARRDRGAIREPRTGPS